MPILLARCQIPSSSTQKSTRRKRDSMGQVPLGSWLKQMEMPSQHITPEPDVFLEPDVLVELSTAYLANVWQFVVEHGRFESEAALLCALGQREQLDRPTQPRWIASTSSLPTLRFIPVAHRWQGSQLHNRLGGVS
jgi:hypothetical protein